MAYPFFDENNYAQSNFLVEKGLIPQNGLGHDGSYMYYTIGASLVNQSPLEPFSGTISVDYNSRHNNLMSAYENLMKRGINGPTEILLPTDEHIGQYELRYIPMLSEDASLTIKSVSNSQNAELKYSSTSAEDNYVLNIMSSKNLKLYNLRLENEGTDFAKVINLHGFNDNLVIENCILAGIETSSTINKNLTLIDARNNFSNNLTIKDNTLYKGTYAFLNESYSSADHTSDNILIENNIFDRNVYGIDLQKADTIQISGNRFNLMKNTSIKLGYFLGTITINNNRIDYLNGMGLHLIHTNTDAYKAIYNNSIRTYGTSNSLSANIQLESINKIDVFYNTMRHNASSSASVFVANSGVNNLKYVNNIAYKQNNGNAASFGNPAGVTTISNNLYFNAQGTNTVNWGGQNINQTSDFDNYDLHQNSIIADPLFVDITNILQSGSPAVGAGLPSEWIFTDIDGMLRGQTPAIGAHEYVEPTFNPPLNLTATPGYNRVALNWEEPQGLMPAGFNVYRDSVLINTELVTMNTYTDFVESDTELTYFVTAVYINPYSGESVPSNIVSATPVTPFFPTPSQLTSSSDYFKISLTWLPPIILPQGNSNQRRNSVDLNQRNLNFVTYRVYRDSILIAETTDLNYDDYDVQRGISYTYYTTAVYQDPDGESAPSRMTTRMLVTPNFIAPQNLSATPAIGEITLNWEHPDHYTIRNSNALQTKNTLVSNRNNLIIAGYNVYRDSVLVNESLITDLSYTDTGLQFGITYNYYVTTVYSYPEGESVASNIISSATLPQIFTVFLEANPVTGGTVQEEGEYLQGSAVTITAISNTGYQFVNWVEHSIRNTQQNLLTSRNSNMSKKSISRENSLTDSVYTFIMPANNKSFLAIFELKTYNLTLIANPETAGIVSGPETFNYQQVINADDLIIDNVGGWLFTGWTSDIEGNIPVVFPASMPAEDVTWYAQFEQVEYTVSLSVNPANSGIVTGNGTYHYNDSVTVTATANAGYQFMYWASETEGRNLLSSSSQMLTRKSVQRQRDVVSTDPVYTFTMPENNVNLTAHFEFIPVFNPPQNLLAEASYTEILLTWAAPENRNRALVGYKVYRDSLAITEVITESMFTDTEVLPNIEYTYFVTAIYQNPNGESIPSNEVSASLLIPVFNPPVNLEGEAIESSIILTWESPQDIPETMTLAGYKVYRDSLAITNVIETTQYTDTNITLDNTYTYFVTAIYVNPDGESVPSNEIVIDYVSENDLTITPTITKLNNNYPNPFNPETTISFSLAEASNVQIEIFDARGRKVKTLINKEFNHGNHAITWNAKDDNGRELSSGMYFYRMKTNTKIETRKMLLIK